MLAFCRPRAKSALVLGLALLALGVHPACAGAAGSNLSAAAAGGTSGSSTLQAETANNTSANDSFTAQLNGLPGPANVSKVDTRSLLYAGSNTKIFAGMLGWFGEAGHMNVGYQSNDPNQVARQVQDMISRGMQGAILDWFGPTENVVNGTAMALRTQAEANPGFEFAMMEDAGALFTAAKANGCDVTTQLLSDLAYINAQYVPSSAYMRVNGRPVIFFFGVDAYYIDWNTVRAQVANNPILVFRGIDGLTRPISDGGFQWLDVPGDPFHPVSVNPFDPVLAPQAAFYQTNPNGRLVVGSAYRGFNDSLAPWGIDRFVHPDCGQTWLSTFGEINQFYSSSNQLPALQIVTWNDYDEGTAIEMGIDNCVFVQPSTSGNTLSWQVGGGPESTIDHYTVFSSTNGQNLTTLANVPAGTHSLDLSSFNLTSGAITLYVKAQGRPSIQNKMSPAIAFRAGDQPPVVKLTVTQTGSLTFSVSTAGSNDPDGSIASSTINFGDGTSAAGPNATHTYANVGTFDITATVVDNAGASSVAIERVSAKAASPGVTIFSPTPSEVVNWPNPAFVASANGPNSIAQMRVLLDGTQLYAINQDTVTTALKIYTGNHVMEVQAIDSTGTVSSASLNITAQPGDPSPTPVTQATPFPQLGANTLLFCGANWQAPNRFVNAFQWTLSDGSPMQFVPGFVHTFPNAGTFSVTQLVINEFGSTGTVTQNVNANNGSLEARSAATHQQDERTQKLNTPMHPPSSVLAPH